MISHLFTAPILVENPVVPPDVFVSLLIGISITLSVSLLLKQLVLVSRAAKAPSEKCCYTSGKSFSSPNISPRTFLR